jgi:cation diffusion facilitator CzcD-associated flavoprotein CzcO/amino acid transporter
MWVVILVVSAASPVTSLLGAVAVGFASGNGIGLPAAFAMVTVILLCFAVGYAAISRRVINTGAFYAYIAQGIGRPVAIGAGLLAVFAYTVNVAGIAGGAGYFLHVIAAELGAQVHWLYGTVPLLVLVGFVGYRSVRASAKVMGTILVLGLAVLLVYDVAILARRGLSAFPWESFQPNVVFSGSVGLALAIALTCFVGVDTAALYSEETRDPERTVPRATYIAVAAMGAFYVLSIWLIIGSIGTDRVVAEAAANPGELVFNDLLAVGGDGLQTAAALIFLGASFAGVLAFHGAASRYLYVLGRDRVVSQWVGRLHPRHRSPFRASLVVSAGAGLLVVVAAVFRLDPYVVLAKGALGLATLGIVTLQALAAVAIVAFFRRRGQGRYWTTLVLPSAGALGLFVIASVVLLSFDDLMGIANPFVFALPWLIVTILIGGIVLGLYLRRMAPARYARLAQARLRPQARVLPRPAQWTRGYCLIGAGPAGLVMGRRLLEEGIPFDWYESGTDVGGIWYADRPGSPVYETLTINTSKRLSAFPDFPMPDHYPDYPQWWQVRDYLRSYAEYHGLYQHITFRTSVTWVKPESLGWSVTLNSGTFKYYSGIIAAPGTAWSPSLPTWPGQERFRGQIWHSTRYKSPSQLAGRRVLVVGAGQSAIEIACDAARAGALTFLSVRRGRRIRPRHLRGVPTDLLLAGLVEPADPALAKAAPRELIASAVGDVGALGLPRPDPSAHAGHPVITDDLLDLVKQGWIHVRGEVAEIFSDRVRFADDRIDQVDLIIAATGYDVNVPFLDPKTYSRDGQPDLFLNMFSRSHEGLALLGLVDLGGPAFPRYDDQARAVIVDITLRELGGLEQRAWRAALQTRPDMSGGARFAETAARAFTVDDNAYSTRLRDLCDRFGYTPAGSWAGLPETDAPPPPGLGAALRAAKALDEHHPPGHHRSRPPAGRRS